MLTVNDTNFNDVNVKWAKGHQIILRTSETIHCYNSKKQSDNNYKKMSRRVYVMTNWQSILHNN